MSSVFSGSFRLEPKKYPMSDSRYFANHQSSGISTTVADKPGAQLSMEDASMYAPPFAAADDDG